jgi:hypothetical protein
MNANSLANTATLDEKVACLEREIVLRVRVYPRLIREGRLTVDERDRELRVMRAILADYVALRPPAHPGPLFDER